MDIASLAQARNIQVIVDLSFGEILTMLVTFLLVGGVGAAMVFRLPLRWMWAGLMAAMPFGVGVLMWHLKSAEINERAEIARQEAAEWADVADLFGRNGRPSPALVQARFDAELARSTRPILWGIFGTVAVLGMAVVCHLSTRKPRKLSLTPSKPPALPGAQTDWPEMES